MSSACLVVGLMLIWDVAADASVAPKPAMSMPVARYRPSLYTQVISAGVYTLLGSPVSGAKILDEATGQTSEVARPPQCSPDGSPVIGGGHIALDCGSTSAVYDIATSTWTSLPKTPACLGAANGGDDGTCQVDGVGKRWLQFGVNCYHCQGSEMWQQLVDGAEGAPNLTSRSVVDLNASQLTRPVCSGITLDRSADTVDVLMPYVIQRNRTRLSISRCNRGVVERDGSVFGFAARPHLVLWVSGLRSIKAVCLPSRRHVSLPSPPRVHQVGNVVLGLHTIYVSGVKVSGRSRYWQTSWPAHC